jgi:hypothetical protein
MRMAMIASLAFLGTAPAAAQSMNAEQFHARATALQKKGPLALFSGDVKLLMTEAKAAGERSHQLRLAAVKAGQKPRYCPPAGKRSMRSDEFMTRLSAIPQSERARIDMTEAMIRILSGKFPCPTA